MLKISHSKTTNDGHLGGMCPAGTLVGNPNLALETAEPYERSGGQSSRDLGTHGVGIEKARSRK